MGLAVLPGRLKEEIAQIKSILERASSVEEIYKLMDLDNNVSKHRKWIKTYIEDEEIGKMISQDIDIFLENAIGETFSRVLEDSGIYKKTEEGKKGFKKFIDYINKN